MTDNLNSINSNEQSEQRWWLLERIRQSNKKILAPIIASASLWWTPALITTSWAAIATTLSSCNPDEPDNPTPPTPDIPDIPEWELISWLENLKNLELRVDQEVNLLNWIIFWEWVSYKVKIEKDWQITEITDPKHYIPNDPWKAYIIITATKNGKEKTERIEKDIKPIEFKSMEINYYTPKEILPIVWQVTEWDPHVYDHIEHLKLAESTIAIEMMRKYGTKNYSPTEYKQLMGRLNTWMNLEIPLWYDNYEFIWCNLDGDPSNHAHIERHTLNTLIKHANFKIIWENRDNPRYANLNTFIKNNPNSINIFWCSAYDEQYNRSKYIELLFDQEIIDMLNSENIIMFSAGTNINRPWWVLKNKIYNWDYEADENWMYSLASMSNSKENSKPNSHLLVTIATDADWDIDQTNEIYESSKYPVWFAKNMLFSGRAFPMHYYTWEIVWEWKANHWKYATSHTNYVNVAMTDLCFQMYAGVPNVNQLLNMIRSSSLTDYIRFNGEIQELQLINPAWFFQMFNLPNDLPNKINPWEIITLNKWEYLWIIFDIPWAEVYINWEWVAYNNTNEHIIKSQNPMHLNWRINWDLCRKMWYNNSKTILWKIIAVDDERKWLGFGKDFTISVE